MTPISIPIPRIRPAWLAARLERVGDRVKLRMYPGVGHVGVVTSFAPLFKGTAPVLADVMAFIQAHPAPGL